MVCSLSLGIWSGYTVPFPGHDPLVFFDSWMLFPPRFSTHGWITNVFSLVMWKVENANKELTNGGTLSAKWLPLEYLSKICSAYCYNLSFIKWFRVVG